MPSPLSSRKLSSKVPYGVIAFLTVCAAVISPFSFGQSQNKPAPRAGDQSRVARPFHLTDELQSRVQTLDSSKQSGDLAAISSASRSVLALALREMGGIELMQGAAPAAIEAYRRSRDFEDSLATRADLAAAYFQARRFDESLSVVTDVLVADPQNARA